MSPGVLLDAWRYMGVFLGPEQRRRQALIQPFMGLGIAVSEIGALVGTLRLLFLLVRDRQLTAVNLFGHIITLSFANVAELAVVCAMVAIMMRVLEARFTSATAALAVHSARRVVVDGWFVSGWEHLAAERLGRLQQLIGANAAQASAPIIFMATASVSLLNLVIYLVIVLVKAPITVMLIALVGGFTALIFTPLRRKQKSQAKLTQQRVRTLQLTATSHAQLAREILVYNVARPVAKVLTGLSELAAEPLRQVRTLSRFAGGTYQQLMLISLVLALVSARSVGVNPTAFGSSLILVLRALAYVQQLNTASINFVEARPYLEELTEAIRDQKRSRPEYGDSLMPAIERIELKSVSYAYPNGKRVLDSVDLVLTQGDWLGIVGPSGSGKTTLINIIAGLISSFDGDYRVNGTAAKAFSREAWARSFAIVSQDPVLLRSSIADNIAFYRAATDEEIMDAAELAGIRREIEAMPLGFNTVVGEGAVSMSGGQRQRISLARALLKKPSCLILDEITSALDARNAELIETSLAGLPKDSIVIVVSHRPALLAKCGRFLKMQEGTWELESAGPDFNGLAFVSH